MLNLENWNKKKILFILSDPGSGNIILSLIKKFNLSNYKIFISSQNRNIKFQGHIKNLVSKSDIYKMNKKKLFDLSVIGTGSNPAYIRLANRLKKDRIFTIAILDHWLNFTSRFKKNNINFIPDAIFLTDYYHNLNNYFFRNIKKVKIKNFYEEEKLKEIKKIKKVKYDYLYINDPASYINNNKIRKKLIEGSFLNFLAYIKSFDKLKILIKFHPNDDFIFFKKVIKNSLKKIENKKIKFYISKENNISQNIGLSKIIFGMQSSALLLAKKSKKQVFTSIPNSFFKKYLNNNYLKNNIKNISNI